MYNNHSVVIEHARFTVFVNSGYNLLRAYGSRPC